MKIHSIIFLIFELLFGINHSICQCSMVSFTDRDDSLQYYFSGNARLFVRGELHNSKGNKEIDLKLIKNLVTHKNMKLIVLELPYSYENVFNHFLKTGDEIDLISISNIQKEEKEITIDFMQKLYEFNNALIPSNKLTIKCIDIEFNRWYALGELSEILNRKEASTAEINEIFKKTIKLNRKKILPSIEKIDKHILKLYSVFLENENEFKYLLGPDYVRFYKILKGMVLEANCFKKNNGDVANSDREYYLAESFTYILKENANETIYGIFGRLHISVAENILWHCQEEWTSMLALLLKNGILKKDEIIPILTYYPNSDFEYGNCNIIIDKTKIEYICSTAKSPLSFFYLDESCVTSLFQSQKFQHLIINKY